MQICDCVHHRCSISSETHLVVRRMIYACHISTALLNLTRKSKEWHQLDELVIHQWLVLLFLRDPSSRHLSWKIWTSYLTQWRSLWNGDRQWIHQNSRLSDLLDWSYGWHCDESRTYQEIRIDSPQLSCCQFRHQDVAMDQTWAWPPLDQDSYYHFYLRNGKL